MLHVPEVNVARASEFAVRIGWLVIYTRFILSAPSAPISNCAVNSSMRSENSTFTYVAYIVYSIPSFTVITKTGSFRSHHAAACRDGVPRVHRKCFAAVYSIAGLSRPCAVRPLHVAHIVTTSMAIDCH